MTPFRLADLVNVAMRALVPLAGIVFLDWQAGNVVFVYCADVLASVYAVCVLVCGRLFTMEPSEGPAWWRRLWAGVQLALTALLPWVVIAVPLAMTMVIVLGSVELDWHAALRSRELWLAAAAQFGAAVALLLRDYDVIVGDRDADRVIKRRFGLVFLRWVIVLLIGWSFLAGLPGYGLTIVLACSIATAAVELYPNRVLRAFGASDLAGAPGAVPSDSADLARNAAHAHAPRGQRRRR